MSFICMDTTEEQCVQLRSSMVQQVCHQEICHQVSHLTIGHQRFLLSLAWETAMLLDNDHHLM